jgi:hypothetical protein
MVQQERYAHHNLKNHGLKHCFSDSDAPTNVYWYSTDLAFISAVKFNFKFVYFYNKHYTIQYFSCVNLGRDSYVLIFKVAQVDVLFIKKCLPLPIEFKLCYYVSGARGGAVG